MWVVITGIIFSYLVGSIPTAYIFGKAIKGIDIRRHGSGNVGATNVFRVMGKWAGITVLALDIFKGFWIIAVASELFGLVDNWQRILLSIAVVLGHNYTIFLGFKGGKGVATSLGVLIGLMVKIPSLNIVVILTLGAFLASFLISHIISISSIIASIVLPIAMVLTRQPLELMVLGLIFSVFVVYRHKPNIQRLLAGKEPKVPLPFGRANKS